MNAALIFAGGTGSRMNSKTRPKQFLELHGRAIIIHTIEHFDRHPQIDAIAVVCLGDWIDYLRGLLKKENIQKVKWIVPGGATGQESIYNGLKAIHDGCENPNDVNVLIHDGVRPLINEQLITDNIACVEKNGCSITVSPAIETIVRMDKTGKIVDTVDRSACSFARAPQCFRLNDIYAAHNRAIAEGRSDFIDSASMMSHYGHALFTTPGPAENIKITTPSDYYIFKSIMEVKESQQILGL